jgi:hypothetical protein
MSPYTAKLFRTTKVLKFLDRRRSLLPAAFIVEELIWWTY